MAVLVCPTPIRVLCVFGTHKTMRDQFYECANQVLKLGRGFSVRVSDNCITTPIGSVLMFRYVGHPNEMIKFAGIKLHDLWVEDGHPFSEEVWKRLQCRVRL